MTNWNERGTDWGSWDRGWGGNGGEDPTEGYDTGWHDGGGSREGWSSGSWHKRKGWKCGAWNASGGTDPNKGAKKSKVKGKDRLIFYEFDPVLQIPTEEVLSKEDKMIISGWQVSRTKMGIPLYNYLVYQCEDLYQVSFTIRGRKSVNQASREELERRTGRAQPWGLKYIDTKNKYLNKKQKSIT